MDGDSLTFSVSDPATHGSLGDVTPTGTTSATVVYTPNANYLGPDAFTFEASDGLSNSTSTVALLVNDERFARIPGLLETPGGPDGYKDNLKRLRMMQAR